jgi:hypothetical protein
MGYGQTDHILNNNLLPNTKQKIVDILSPYNPGKCNGRSDDYQ